MRYFTRNELVHTISNLNRVTSNVGRGKLNGGRKGRREEGREGRMVGGRSGELREGRRMEGRRKRREGCGRKKDSYLEINVWGHV